MGGEEESGSLKDGGWVACGGGEAGDGKGSHARSGAGHGELLG